MLSLVSALFAVYPRSSVIGVSLTMRDQITPLILTFNEAPESSAHAGETKMGEANRGARQFQHRRDARHRRSSPQVRLVQRRFTHPDITQWNHGVDQVQTDWVSALDADYVLNARIDSRTGGVA